MPLHSPANAPPQAVPAWEYGSDGPAMGGHSAPPHDHSHPAATSVRSWAQRVGRLAQSVCGGDTGGHTKAGGALQDSSLSWLHSRWARRGTGRDGGEGHSPLASPALGYAQEGQGLPRVNPWGTVESQTQHAEAEQPSTESSSPGDRRYAGLTLVQALVAVALPLLIRLSILLTLASLLLPWWLWSLPDPEAVAGEGVAWVGGGVWLWEARSCVGRAQGRGQQLPGIYCFASEYDTCAHAHCMPPSLTPVHLLSFALLQYPPQSYQQPLTSCAQRAGVRGLSCWPSCSACWRVRTGIGRAFSGQRQLLRARKKRGGKVQAAVPRCARRVTSSLPASSVQPPSCPGTC